MPDLEDKFARSPDVVTREFDGELVLLRVAGSVADMRALFVLNAMGARIWERLDGATTLQAIVDDVVARYEVAPDIASGDACALVASLLEGELIERRSSV